MTMKTLFMKKIISGLYAFLFIVALLMISLMLERRHLYF